MSKARTLLLSFTFALFARLLGYGFYIDRNYPEYSPFKILSYFASKAVGFYNPILSIFGALLVLGIAIVISLIVLHLAARFIGGILTLFYRLLAIGFILFSYAAGGLLYALIALVFFAALFVPTMRRIKYIKRAASLSVKVVIQEKEIIGISFLSVLVAISIAILYFISLIGLYGAHVSPFSFSPTENYEAELVAVFLILSLLLYLRSNVFESRIIAVADERYESGTSTVKSSLKKLTEVLGTILAYAVVARVVMIVIKTLKAIARKNKSPIVENLLEAAYSLREFINYYTKVSIVTEKIRSLKEAIKRSISFIRRYAIDTIIGIYGLGFAVAILTIIAYALSVGIPYLLLYYVFTIEVSNYLLGTILLGSAVVYYFFMPISTVFKTIMYRYYLDLERGSTSSKNELVRSLIEEKRFFI